MIRLFVCLVVVCSPCLLPAQEQGANETAQKLVSVRVAVVQINGDYELKDGAAYSSAVFDKLMASLREQKILDSYKFFNLTSIENQQAMIQIGQQEGVISGRTASRTRSTGTSGFSSATRSSDPRGSFGSATQSGGTRGGTGALTPDDAARRFGSAARGGSPSGFAGRVSNTYTMRQTGSAVHVVSRVRDDGKIIVQLEFDSSRLVPAQQPESEATDENRPASDFLQPTLETIQCNTTALLEPGMNTVIVAQGKDSTAKASRAYLIVSATAK